MILEMLGATLPWHHLLKNKTPESKQKIYEIKVSYHTQLKKFFWDESGTLILKRVGKQTTQLLYNFAKKIKSYGFYEPPAYVSVLVRDVQFL